MLVLACGARSELGGDLVDGEDAAAVDATLDAKKHDDGGPSDASSDVHADAHVDAGEAGLCCDLGVLQSPCHDCGGDTCWDKVGACHHDVTKCGPSNCNGCCLSDTWCADGLEIGACGSGGRMCQTCFGAKQNQFVACVPDDAGGGGTCEGGPTCTPQNCISGCCNGNLCMFGELDTSCGYATSACTDCTTLGGYCDGDICDYPHQ